MTDAQLDRIDVVIEHVIDLLASAEVVSPVEGIVLRPLGPTLLGTYVRPGDVLCNLAVGEMRIELDVDERAAEGLHLDQLLDVTFAAHPGTVVKAKVIEILPSGRSMESIRPGQSRTSSATVRLATADFPEGTILGMTCSAITPVKIFENRVQRWLRAGSARVKALSAACGWAACDTEAKP